MTDTAPTRADRLLPLLRLIGWGSVAALLIAPAVAMRFNPEVRWTAFDFIVAGVVLIGAGLICELAVRASRDWRYRLGVIATVAACILLVWITGAVGVTGSEADPRNLWLGLVPATVLSGAIWVRFRANGMARVLIIAAALQLGIGAWAFLAERGAITETSSGVILVFTGTLSAAFLVAAALFWGARQT